jgi:hypothetical protein
MLDGNYMSELFQLITKKSRLTSDQLSTMIVNELSRAVLEQNFDLCEQILRLPFQSFKISLPTYELIQFIHTCSNSEQLFDCLSILIEKNLPHDSEYFSWVLIILFEHYQIGDEIIIEHLLNIKKNINLLFTCYGSNNVTPLMLFLHLYSNNKCQILIDHHLSNINQPSILLQCDRWNRSYLMHLLCGRCQHDFNENSLECSHASAVLSRFSMLYKLGNRFDTPIKRILTSEYCLPLRMVLLNYFLENNSLSEVQLDELFQYFPPRSISIYADNLKKIIQNRNLDSVLTSRILKRREDEHYIDYTIKFLLQQGARIENMNIVHPTIFYLLSSISSMIPFMLLNYSFYIDITFDMWLHRHCPRMNLYICCVLRYGYPSELRNRFEKFKSHLPDQLAKVIEKLIDVKTPSCLSKLCLQKLRISLKNLGNETIDELKDCLPVHLRKSIRSYAYDEFQSYFK